jgi:AsmA family protein
LSDLDAMTAKGRLRGAISIDARESLPLWRFDLNWDGIHLEDWLKSAKARSNGKSRNAGQAAPPPYIAGTLHGRTHLMGSGQSTARLLGSMSGDITLFVRHGSVSHLVVEILGLDVAQGLGLVLSGDEPLPIRCAVVDLQAKQGLLTPKVALVDTPVTLVLTDGKIDLAKERLDLRVVARPKNVSPLTLRSPILVQGPFASPRTTPEPGPIAVRILGGIALAFANPLAAIIPFIDPGDNVASPCNQSLATLRR